MKSGWKQVLNCYVVYNLHYMFNIVDYFIDYKYLEDSLKNLNISQRWNIYENKIWFTMFWHHLFRIIDYLIVIFERYFKEFEYIPIIKYGWNIIVYFTDK